MSKKKHVETETVTLKMPEPIFHFYRAMGEAYDKNLEDMLIQQLTDAVVMIIDSNQASEILSSCFGLKEYLKK